MTRTVIIIYAPGAYGSFLGWSLDRFNTIRADYEPTVLDNPLQGDGSSHSYASFCKVRDTRSFIDELEKCRNQRPHWNYSIYGGWPASIGADINVAIHQLYSWMHEDDRIIFVERPTLKEVFLCWLNNETKMSRERWYGILNISDDVELTKRLHQEVETRELTDTFDSRLLRISVNDILYSNPQEMLEKLHKHVGWETYDSEHFVAIHEQMLALQNNISVVDGLLNGNIPQSAAQQSIVNYIKGEK